MGWIDKERNKLTQALYRRNAEDMPVTNLLPIFNFEAALTKMAERGCACNEIGRASCRERV